MSTGGVYSLVVRLIAQPGNKERASPKKRARVLFLPLFVSSVFKSWLLVAARTGRNSVLDQSSTSHNIGRFPIPFPSILFEREESDDQIKKEGGRRYERIVQRRGVEKVEY